MKNIKAFNKFNKYLFRVCSKNELKQFLKDGQLSPKFANYISLSDTLDQDNIDYYIEQNNNLEIYNIYLLTFDMDKLKKQGCFKIKYTVPFVKNNPDVYQHFNGGNINDDSDKEIEDTLFAFNHESEWLIKKIKLVPELLLNVEKLTGNKTVEKEIINSLKEINI